MSSPRSRRRASRPKRQRKQKVGASRGNRSSGRSMLTRRNAPWYQKQIQVRIPGVNVTYSTGTAGAGLAAVVSIGTNLIENFDSSWSQCFDEYRIIKCEFWFTMLAAAYNAAGLLYAYIDEDDNSTPSLNTATSHGAKIFSLSAEASRLTNERGGREHSGPVLKWSPLSYIDEDWYNASSSPVSFAYLKMLVPAFSDRFAANLFEVTAWVTLAFRGFQTPTGGLVSSSAHVHASVSGLSRLSRLGYTARPAVPTDYLHSGTVCHPGSVGGITNYKDTPPSKDLF